MATGREVPSSRGAVRSHKDYPFALSSKPITAIEVHPMNWLLAWCLIGTLFLTSCTTVAPYRTQLSTPPAKCPASGQGSVDPICANQATELGNSYRLHFVEFDDQGRTYANRAPFGIAHGQIKNFLDDVQARTDANTNDAGVSVVVFVHGWKHTAQSEDKNLKAFRRVLEELAAVEQAAYCKRQIIGLYVGWRGAGSHLGEPLESATFWSRKLAAEHVATGSFQQVLAGLKAIQSETPNSTRSRAPRAPDCSSRLKTTYVGHSFGGLIVLTALTQDLQRGLMLDQQRLLLDARGRDPAKSPDEMIIAINPAIEGARFDALYRTASIVNYTTYRSPRLIAITATNDKATGIAFPFGRLVNTVTKQYPEGDALGRSAARRAMGHDPQFLTHHLAYTSRDPNDPKSCDAWEAAQTLDERADNDVLRAQAFYGQVGPGYDANEPTSPIRTFCAKSYEGSNVLSLEKVEDRKTNANSPIWNVTTQPPILDGHSDIQNPRMLEFLRQLYVDSMFFR